MRGKTETDIEQRAGKRCRVTLPPVEQFEEAFRRLEIDELFRDAEEMGLDRLAGHVLAEANLDFVTDEPFDQTGEESASDEPF